MHSSHGITHHYYYMCLFDATVSSKNLALLFVDTVIMLSLYLIKQFSYHVADTNELAEVFNSPLPIKNTAVFKSSPFSRVLSRTSEVVGRARF